MGLSWIHPLFYWSKLYLKQIERGEDYKELNRSISIIFLDYEIEKLKELPIHTKWQIRNDKNGKKGTDPFFPLLTNHNFYDININIF